MANTHKWEGAEQQLAERTRQATDRRTFLKWSGVGAAALAVGACEDTYIVQPDGIGGAAVTIDFSNNNPFGVLNYAYALEQLEAAFYTMVVGSFYTGATPDEQAILTDIRDHEVAHREFFRAKIMQLGGTPIPGLEVDFRAVNFGNRQSVLTTAQTLEDLGVWAYNGAASLVTLEPVIMAAGDIVSVEARHAAAIRDLLDPLSFAPLAFDRALPPTEVLQMADPFIATEITLVGLPAGM